VGFPELLTRALETSNRGISGFGQLSAVELVRKIFGDLQKISILVVGTGKMGEAASGTSPIPARKPFI